MLKGFDKCTNLSKRPMMVRQPVKNITRLPFILTQYSLKFLGRLEGEEHLL